MGSQDDYVSERSAAASSSREGYWADRGEKGVIFLFTFLHFGVWFSGTHGRRFGSPPGMDMAYGVRPATLMCTVSEAVLYLAFGFFYLLSLLFPFSFRF